MRLENVVHAQRALCLVFEHLDLDLKQQMDTTPNFTSNAALIKARPSHTHPINTTTTTPTYAHFVYISCLTHCYHNMK